MSVLEVAVEHQRQRRRLSRRAEAATLRLWRQVDPNNIRDSWRVQVPRATTILAGAQLSAASKADDYIGAATSELGVDTDALGRVVPESLAGLSADGRSLPSLLAIPGGYVLRDLSRGESARRALASGQKVLQLILRTEIADAGRVADGVAIAATPTMGYVRHVSPPSCPRCAILAGRWYRYSSGFQRHPGCDCTMIPAPRPRTREDVSTDLTADPKRLLREGHIRGLSKDDTKAILEDGADMNRVINAHRGMYTAAGNRKLTTELSPFGGQRLRPETIYREALSREDAVRLLRLHGYLA